jgi:hypothetical protein
MGTDAVVVFLELVERLLKFSPGFVKTAIEFFVAQLAKEALDVSVLPRRSWNDELVEHVLLGKELRDVLGAKLRSVVAPEDHRFTVDSEEPSEFLDKLVSRKARSCFEAQVFSGAGVKDSQNPSFATVF